VDDTPTTQPAGPREAAPATVVLASALEPPTTSPSSPSSLLAGAKAKIDAGNLLSTRTQLNDTLQSGQLNLSDESAIKAMISQINQTVVFGREHFPDDPWGGTYSVQSGDSLAKIAAAHDTTWELLSRINGIDPKHLRAGATIKVVEGPFFGVVDKHKFTLDLYLGGLPGERSSMYVTTFSVGLGRDQSTPVGTWMIEPHHKLKHPTYYSPRGEGVIAADDPKNPLGGYWIGLTGTEGQALGKLSYGIHGTIDPASIGKQSSMGCIRLRSEDIALVYDLMVEGKSMVVVKD
jgi:lipoprotein-anchoring transpeptidase ErfK/SrfK